MAKRTTKHTQDESMAELSSAEISPLVARVVSWTFVAIISLVPVVQISWELSHGQTPQIATLFAPVANGIRQALGGDGALALKTAGPVLTRDFLHKFEEDLERNSLTKSWVQPRMQEVITGVLGFGNHKSVVAPDHWLFYQPGVDYVAGPGILQESHLRALAKKLADKEGISRPQPDPRPAIISLHEQLRQYGIHLVVMPTTDKASLQPAQLTSRTPLKEPAPPSHNVGYGQFAGNLRSAGVDLFDPSPALIAPGELRFLQQDTHWTPEFMDDVATRLASHIRRTVNLPPAPGFSTRLVEQSVTRVGDLVDMLSLTAGQRIYPPVTVRIQRVIDQNSGKPLEASPDADVLVIGDSYTNIYSQADMGWGANAGFAEHLAHHLGRPVDVIAFNGGGTSRSRAELARLENAERLGCKRVVIYQFAERNLLGENWKVLAVTKPLRSQPPAQPQSPAQPEPPAPSVPLVSQTGELARPASAAPEGSTRPEPSAAPLVIIGQISRMSKMPTPGAMPYKDCLVFVNVRVEKVVSGSYSEPDLVAVFEVMKDNQLLPPAKYTTGTRVQMTLTPLRKADPQIRSMQRSDDLDDWVHQPYFVTEDSLP